MTTRRGFAMAMTAASWSRVSGANERVRIGVLGSGGRGTYIARCAQEYGGAEIVALADVAPARMANAQKSLGIKAATHGDYRAVLERRDIDAAIIGSPDHWHVPMTVAAVAAGKDVYVEKPLTHSVEEGQIVIDAVRKSGRVVQAGYQQRSYPHFREACELVRSGRIGRVTQVLTWWNQNFAPQSKPQVEASAVDWKGFLGSACPREFDPWRYGHWRWFWDYGGGTLTDLFSHWIDSVHWVMDDSVPRQARGQGAKLHNEFMECPDTVSLALMYPKKFQVNFVSTMVTKMDDGGILFRGTGGSLKLLRPFFELYSEAGEFDKKTFLPAAERRVEAQRDGTIDHVLNWLDCIKTRKPPNAGVETSVDAANAAHWGNEAIRSGRSLELPLQAGGWRPLFNGRDLEGWVEDTPGIWMVRDGMITGRHSGQKWNDYLRTRESFGDFELALEFRLAGGMGNSGIQFWSVPAEKPHELSGYQADIGEKYWACLYDERLRHRVLGQAPAAALERLNGDAWHTYVIRAIGDHITLTFDGMRTVDYTETERGMLQRGIIALQVHSGPGIEVWFRNLRIRELG